MKELLFLICIPILYFYPILSPTLQNFSAHGAGIDLLIYLLTAHQYLYIAHINEPLVFFGESYNSITMTSKANFLRSCYFQSQIWFADNYLFCKETALLVIRAWLVYCLREKIFLSKNRAKLNDKCIKNP